MLNEKLEAALEVKAEMASRLKVPPTMPLAPNPTHTHLMLPWRSRPRWPPAFIEGAVTLVEGAATYTTHAPNNPTPLSFPSRSAL